MKTEADVDEAMRGARQDRAVLLLAQARGKGRAVALARAIYAVPALVLIVGALASGSPTVILVLFAMAFCVVATETVLDRRIEALLTVLQLKGQVPPDERWPRTSP